MAKEKSFGELLIEGLEEAVAYDRGELEGATVRRVRRTARETEVAPPPRYDARRVARVRHELDVSQRVFARLLNVSSSTVRAWEQGTREPEGPTRRLLELAERHPEVITASAGAPGASRVESTGSPGKVVPRKSAKKPVPNNRRPGQQK